MFCEGITSKNGLITENERVESGSKGVKSGSKDVRARYKEIKTTERCLTSGPYGPEVKVENLLAVSKISTRKQAPLKIATFAR